MAQIELGKLVAGIGKIEFQGTRTSETKTLLRIYVLECEVALLKKEVAKLLKAQPPTKKKGK